MSTSPRVHSTAAHGAVSHVDKHGRPLGARYEPGWREVEAARAAALVAGKPGLLALAEVAALCAERTFGDGR